MNRITPIEINLRSFCMLCGGPVGTQASQSSNRMRGSRVQFNIGLVVRDHKEYCGCPPIHVSAVARQSSRLGSVANFVDSKSGRRPTTTRPTRLRHARNGCLELDRCSIPALLPSIMTQAGPG